MSSLIDHEPLAAAIKLALNAVLPEGVEAYDVDEVPGTNGVPGSVPTQHVEIQINRRYVPERRFGGYVAVPGRDLVTRCHADSIYNVRELRRIVAAALEDQILPPAEEGGEEVGPFTFSIGEPEDDDDTGWVGADFWTL